MTNLFEGRTNTYGATFISDGSGAGDFTFTIPFQPDRIALFNYTKFGTAAQIPVSWWFRGMPAGDALEWQVIVDNGVTGNQNMVLQTTNGYTEANTTGGVTALRSNISAVTQADPCVVTTAAAHGLTTNMLIRITDLNGSIPTARGMDELNNKRFRVVVVNATTFQLKDPITDEFIDSTGFVAYVSGGFVTAETRTQGFDDPIAFEPVIYKVTVAAALLGANSDVYYMEVLKYGQRDNLGDLADLR